MKNNALFEKISVIIVFLLSSFTSRAQVNLGFALGAHYSKENTAPLAKLSISAETNGVIIEAAQYVSLTRNIDPGTMLGGTIGYDINGLIPVAGYFYNLKSTDRKTLNSAIYGGGLRWRKFMNDNAGITAEAIYLSNNNITAAFGITYQF